MIYCTSLRRASSTSLCQTSCLRRKTFGDQSPYLFSNSNFVYSILCVLLANSPACVLLNNSWTNCSQALWELDAYLSSRTSACSKSLHCLLLWLSHGCPRISPWCPSDTWFSSCVNDMRIPCFPPVGSELALGIYTLESRHDCCTSLNFGMRNELLSMRLVILKKLVEDWRYSSEIQHLPDKHKVLSLILSTKNVKK